MNSLLEQLHDIDGLDAISSWPLAIGWWAVITAGSIMLLAIACYILCRIAYSRSWKGYTTNKLSYLERNLSDKTARETAELLSEYLKRIAIKKYSRKLCAGLTGYEWLKWLKKHDPKQFDWEAKGQILIEAPYAPIGKEMPCKDLKDLIEAAKKWVV